MAKGSNEGWTGHVILLVGVALLALSASLVKYLVRHGGELGLTEPGAISFCNVLFLGNLLGGLLILLRVSPRRLLAELKGVPLRARGLLALNACFAVVIPATIFTALETTTVTNAILLGRLESIVFVLLAFLLGSASLGRYQLAGYVAILAGILTLVSVEGMGNIQRGDVLVMVAAVLQALAAFAARAALEKVSLGLFVFTRNFCSAIVFFVLAVSFYGWGHFADAFAPGLWVAMTAYALLVVVGGQSAWYHGLLTLPSTTVSNLAMLSPAFGIGFAYLLLGETPGMAQIIGGVVILAGMGITRLRSSKAVSDTESSKELPATEQSLAGV